MSTAVIGVPEFKARSGRTVRMLERGDVAFDHANGYLAASAVFDAEEFFQAKRDAELGRWRDPLNPDYVVSRWGDAPEEIRVFHEPTARYEDFTRDKAVLSDWIPSSVAFRYFAEHPKKPWHDAEPGDVWVLTVRGFTLAWVADGDGDFQHLVDPESISATDPEIMDGRKIWPEDAS